MYPLDLSSSGYKLYVEVLLMELKLAGLVNDSLVNGEGLRTVIFAQGCKHNCDGCFSPHTHDMNGASFIVETKDRKSTRLNSSHANISYAVFCLKKKKI